MEDSEGPGGRETGGLHELNTTQSGESAPTASEPPIRPTRALRPEVPVESNPTDIPLQDGAGLPSSATHRRWIEGLLISLAPFLGLTVLRLLTSDFNFAVINYVDLCLAMFSAAAVLSVQVIDSSRRGDDVVSRLLIVIVFVVGFIFVAAAQATASDRYNATLEKLARNSSDMLARSEIYISNAKSGSASDERERIELEIAIRDSSRALKEHLVQADEARSFSKGGAVTFLLSLGFLIFAIRVWRGMP